MVGDKRVVSLFRYPIGKVDLSHAGLIRLLAGSIAVAMALYHMWVIVTGTPEAIIFRGTHLLFALALTFLIFRRTAAAADGAPSALDYLLLALALAPTAYLFWNYDYVVNRIYYIDDLSTTDMIMAVLLVVLVLEATRRLIGLALPITAVVFLIYGLFVARVEPMRLLDQLDASKNYVCCSSGGIAAHMRGVTATVA